VLAAVVPIARSPSGSPRFQAELPDSFVAARPTVRPSPRVAEGSHGRAGRRETLLATCTRCSRSEARATSVVPFRAEEPIDVHVVVRRVGSSESRLAVECECRIGLRPSRVGVWQALPSGSSDVARGRGGGRGAGQRGSGCLGFGMRVVGNSGEAAVVIHRPGDGTREVCRPVASVLEGAVATEVSVVPADESPLRVLPASSAFVAEGLTQTGLSGSGFPCGGVVWRRGVQACLPASWLPAFGRGGGRV